MTRRRNRDLISFADLDLSLYARTELSGKCRGEGGESLPDRVEAAMRVIMSMAMLATHDNARMRREATTQLETQWGNQLQRVKGGINHSSMTNNRVVGSEAFEKELSQHVNADLMRLREAVRMTVMNLKLRVTT